MPKTQSNILDHRGEPIVKDVLADEIAKPSLTGVRQVWHVESMANGLTPERLASILDAANNGDHHAYLTLAQEMEERDPHYAAVLGTRKLAVAALDVTVEAASDKQSDIDLADAVRKLTKAPAFDDLLTDLLDGLGKGYSAVEILWQGGKTWQPQYAWRDPRWFLFDQEDGTTLKLVDEADPMGIGLPPYKFITHMPKLRTGLPSRGGLARLATVSYMCKAWDLKDWMAFVDIFGLPFRVGKYSQAASEDDIAVLVNAVANIASDAGAVIPDSMRIELESAPSATGGDQLFERLAEWLDKQVSKAVLGQTMTTDDGSSQSQANVHNDVRLDILKADAKALQATLNRDLIRPYIDLNYGQREEYPELVLFVPVPENIELLVTAIEKLTPFGFKVEQSVVRDKLGLPDPEIGEDGNPVGDLFAAPQAPMVERLATNRALAMNRQAHEHATDVIDVLADEALAEWEEQLAPIINPIQKLAAEAQDYDEFLARLPELLGEMDETELANALAEAAFKARAEGDAEN